MGKPENSKISSLFAARLEKVGANNVVRAMVMLHVQPARKNRGFRQNQVARDAAVETAQEAAETGLRDIDRILTQFKGRRLTDKPNALGTVAVEATPEGIRALAEIDLVKAILEDQDIKPLH